MKPKETKGLTAILGNKISKAAARPLQELDAVSPEDNSKKVIALKKAGVTRELIYSKLYEGLNAVRVKIDSDERGEPVEVQVPDLIIRHKYIDTAARIYGDLKETNVSVGVQVNVSKEERELLDAYKNQ